MTLTAVQLTHLGLTGRQALSLLSPPDDIDGWMNSGWSYPQAVILADGGPTENDRLVQRLGVHRAIVAALPDFLNPGPDFPYSDSFDSSPPDVGWLPLNGTWAVGASEIHKATVVGGYALLARDVGVTDHVSQSTFQVHNATPNTGVAARVVDAGTYLWADFVNGSVRLASRIGGAGAVIDSVAYSLPVDTDVQLTLTVVGTAVTVMVDDVQKISAILTDSELLTGTSVGLVEGDITPTATFSQFDAFGPPF